MSCQAARQDKGQEQGAQRQCCGFEENFLLPGVEGVIRHADDHVAQVLLRGLFLAGNGVLEEVVVQRDPLQVNGGVEDLDLCTAPTLAASLFDIHQNIVGTVANLQEAHVWRFQGGLQQGVEHFQVA
ncbi:hypothetical protein D3C80_1067840 [compost metagenome]